METIAKFCYHNYFILIGGLLVSFWMMKPFIFSGFIELRFIGFIGTLYPAGKFFQFTHYGSDWIRSYLADIGFTAAIAVFLFVGNFFKKPTGNTSIYERLFFFQKMFRIYLFIAFAAAVIAEGIQLYGNQLQMERNGKLSWGARGDINDVAAFIISTVVLVIIVNSIDHYPKLKRT